MPHIVSFVLLSFATPLDSMAIHLSLNRNKMIGLETVLKLVIAYFGCIDHRQK